MVDIELTTTGTSVTSDLTTAYIGGWLSNGTDRPVGWQAYIKPASNATFQDLFWELRDSSTSTTYASGFVSVADFNANWNSTIDSQGFKKANLRMLNGTWQTPQPGNFITLGLSGQGPNQWLLKSGTVVNSTFQMQPVPEPGSLALAAIGIVAIAILGWRKRRKQAALA